jgi:hypothetical protein
MTAPLDPQQVAEHLDDLGETTAALLIRAMARELATVRNERDTLAEFARRICRLSGDGMTHNCTLIVPAREALDVLRVTRRCPVDEDGRHTPVRHLSGTRCMRCHARVPETTRRKERTTRR